MAGAWVLTASRASRGSARGLSSALVATLNSSHGQEIPAVRAEDMGALGLGRRVPVRTTAPRSVLLGQGAHPSRDARPRGRGVQGSSKCNKAAVPGWLCYYLPGSCFCVCFPRLMGCKKLGEDVEGDGPGQGVLPREQPLWRHPCTAPMHSTRARHPAFLLGSHCDCEGECRQLRESIKHAPLNKKSKKKKDRQKKRKKEKASEA